MDEITKNFIDDFKWIDVKTQFAYLDVLKDLLIYTRKEFKPKTTPNTVLISKAVKDSDLFELEQYKNNEEKLKEELTIFVKFFWNILESMDKIVLDRWIWVFSYSKPTEKFLEELNEQYTFIDDKTYKTISLNRQSFLSSLEVLWLIEKIDMKQFWKDVIDDLNKKEVFEKELTLNDLFEYLWWFFDFSWKDLQILDIENIKDEKVRKYLEIIISFFPHTDYLKDTNDELKNLKLSFYYYDIEKLKELDVKFSFNTNIKNRKQYFKYEWWELIVNWFKVSSPTKDTKIDNILDIIYKWAIKDNNLDFVWIRTLKNILSENLESYKFFNKKFFEDYYYWLHYKNYKEKQDKFNSDNYFNTKDRLVKKYVTTKKFDDSLKSINKSIFGKIFWINKKFFRMTKDWVYIQYK